MISIKNIVFDFGGVLVDWNPHYLYDRYLGSREHADWFLQNICTSEWNTQMDAGKPFAEGIAEKITEHPEYEAAIRAYQTDWMQMMGGQIPTMQVLVEALRNQGYHLYGLTNWSAETFCQVRPKYPIFNLLDGIVVSGEEKIAKPDLRIFQILMERYGITPSESIFTDDNLPNLVPAQTLGFHTIHFLNPAQLRHDLQTHFGIVVS